jgi:hypothetical protein
MSENCHLPGTRASIFGEPSESQRPSQPLDKVCVFAQQPSNFASLSQWVGKELEEALKPVPTTLQKHETVERIVEARVAKLNGSRLNESSVDTYVNALEYFRPEITIGGI